MKYFKRTDEIESLERIASSKKSEFIYVRGRRRIGKSWLLDEFTKNNPKQRLLFTVASDSTKINTIRLFIDKWCDFSGDQPLRQFKASYFTWPKIFEEINKYTKENNKPLVLIFVEIQWIAKDGTGFAGALKEAWVTWQKNGLIKVIVCGSSNKFFRKKTNGEEKILRGLQTKANLYVKPLTPAQVKAHCFSSWRNEEVCLIYMMIGGIPYYLERIEAEKNFVHAINDALFTYENNLLHEVKEILSLDFNSSGQSTAENILSTLGQDGAEQKTIIIKTGLYKGTVSKIIDKLLDYEILFKKSPAHKKLKRNQEGILYYMKDFFLNFYFQVLYPLKGKIENNKSGLLFPYDTKLSQNGYYIPGFSGKAFELFVRYILENAFDLDSPLFNKMMLKDTNYSVLDYWDNKTQIDLIVEHNADKISRIVECKWGGPDHLWIKQIKSKKYIPPKGYSKKYYIVTSAKPTR